MFAESVSAIPATWAAVNSWFTPATFFVVLNLTIGTIYITSSLAAAPATVSDTDGGGDEQRRRAPPLARSPSVLQRIRSIKFHTPRSEEPTFVFAADFKERDDPRFEEAENDDVTLRSPSVFTRSPSMLQRLKSMNFYTHRSEEPTTVFADQAPDIEQRDGSRFQMPANDDVTLRSPPSPSVSQRLGSAELNDHISAEPTSPPATRAAVYGVSPAADAESDLGERVEEGHRRVNRTRSDTEPSAGEIPVKLAGKMRKSASVKSSFWHFEEGEVVEARRPATAREVGVEAREEEEVDARADDFINRFKQQLKLQRMDSIIRYREMVGRGSGDK